LINKRFLAAAYSIKAEIFLHHRFNVHKRRACQFLTVYGFPGAARA